MQRREQMDRASAKLSRARLALSLAMKAGTEATKGELLEVIVAALEHVDAADAALGEDETRLAQPGLSAPAAVGSSSQPRPVARLASSNPA
ncbi:hypothetical protein D3C78_957800 [compost metagenome]